MYPCIFTKKLQKIKKEIAPKFVSPFEALDENLNPSLVDWICLS